VDQDQATAAGGAGETEPLPAGLKKALSLTVGPDHGGDLLDCWVAVGAQVVAGPKGWTTQDALSDTQLHDLAVKYADLRERIVSEGRASIVSIGRGSSSDIESIHELLQAAAAAPVPEHERNNYGKQPKAAEERRQARLPELPEWLQ
jgi:hypothetical protein